MPQAARNITTDGPFALGDGQPFFDKNPASLPHYQFHEHQDKKRNGQRTQLAQDNETQRGIINESKVEEGRLAREYEKSRTQPFKTDENGKSVPVDWQGRFKTVRARASATIATNDHARKQIGPDVVPELQLFIAKYQRTLRSLEMPLIVDDRAPGVIIAERERALKEIENEEIEVQDANRTDAEAEAVIRADYQRRKLAGAPTFGNVLQGGSFRTQGQFTPSNPGARPQFAATAAIVHDTSVFVEVDDALNFAIWADDDEKILAKLLKAARAQNAGVRQISEPDKVKMLREIAVRKLAAQRQLEAAYRHAEAQGIQVKRRPLPPEVLLWLELDPAARHAPKAKTASPPPPVDDALDFEGHSDE